MSAIVASSLTAFAAGAFGPVLLLAGRPIVAVLPSAAASATASPTTLATSTPPATLFTTIGLPFALLAPLAAVPVSALAAFRLLSIAGRPVIALAVTPWPIFARSVLVSLFITWPLFARLRRESFLKRRRRRLHDFWCGRLFDRRQP